jgi:KRAB domain-containing zinc finger protein
LPVCVLSDICDKGFCRNDSLQKHIRIHTGDKHCKCDICGRVFSQNDSLQKHIRTHTGDKPYKCDICGRVFSQNDNLQKYIRTHTYTTLIRFITSTVQLTAYTDKC